jgi:homoserine O-acetyltransferase/O-succinyltransferase
LSAAPPSPLGQFTLRDFRLESGVVMPEVTLCYGAWGRLAADGRNAVVVGHGYTTGPGMVDRNAVGDGSWSQIVGPGKPFDTERFYVVCANMLGSCFGSTGPGNIDPATGQPYGSRFPDITLVDIIRTQRLLLDHLGVKHLTCVVGPSLGGSLAFQWAVSYPEDASGFVPVLCVPMANNLSIAAIAAPLARDPNWHGGDYYGRGDMRPTLQKIRLRTLRSYGFDTVIARTLPDEAAREVELQRLAANWAARFDPNSLIVLMKPLVGFDLRPHFHRIRARIHYALSRTDRVFAPTIAAEVTPLLQAAGVDAEYFEIDSPYQHFGLAVETHKWEPRLRAFIETLVD